MIYIENLNALSLRVIETSSELKDPDTISRMSHCFYIDSNIGDLAKYEKQTGFNINKLKFIFDDIRDREGTTIGWKITFEELQKVLLQIVNHPSYSELFESKACLSEYFLLFLKKGISDVQTSSEWPTLWSTLFKIHVVAWHNQRENTEGDTCFFVMENRIWKSALSDYAKELKVSLLWQHTQPSLKEFLRKKKLHYPKMMALLRAMRGLKLAKLLALKSDCPKIAIESIGSFHFRQPELFSDVAYWHQSLLPAQNLLLYTNRPVTDQQWEECQEANVDIVGLSGGLNKNISLFIPAIMDLLGYDKGGRVLQDSNKNKILTEESMFVQHQVEQYNHHKNYWTSFFKKTNSKIHVTHFKYGNQHLPRVDAIEELGGISVLWQLSYENNCSTALAASSDIMFSFSSAHALVEQGHGSKIGYHVATGYPGDYRFPLLKNKAMKVRKQLQENGAKKIIAFFDENSSEDDRWSISNAVACKEYSFLLEKVLTEPELGVIFKPKKPHTLRKRLKEIDDLFENAIATGRCNIFMAEASAIPPSVAALASDIAIHGCVWAATAGFEAALTGVPTLLLDPDNWRVSQLYQLGEGKVVFQTWNHLWETLQEHWSTPAGVPGFGDWSSLIAELDPFRDGKAAERMGTYLHWLIQGFEQGLGREVIMADAAERYCKQWGNDKVITHIGI